MEIQGYASLPLAIGGLGVGILNAADDLAGAGARLAGRAGAITGYAQRRSLPPRIRLTQKSLEHIVFRHWPTSGISRFDRPAGKFLPGMTARKLKEIVHIAGERGMWSPARGGRFQIDYDFAQQVGIDRFGNPATRVRVIIETEGDVVTAYPF